MFLRVPVVLALVLHHLLVKCEYFRLQLAELPVRKVYILIVELGFLLGQIVEILVNCHLLCFELAEGFRGNFESGLVWVQALEAELLPSSGVSMLVDGLQLSLIVNFKVCGLRQCICSLLELQKL